MRMKRLYFRNCINFYGCPLTILKENIKRICLEKHLKVTIFAQNGEYVNTFSELVLTKKFLC